MKRRILIGILVISLFVCLCTIFSACTSNSAGIEQVECATIEDNKIYMFVSSDIDEVSLSDKVKCSQGNSWKLYYDNLGQTEIPTKIATGKYGYLQDGNNIFYVVVTSKDGTSTNTYELTIYRSYSIHISYYDGDTLLKSEWAYTGVEYIINYSPNLTGYTFNGWKTIYGESVTAFTPWESTKLYTDKMSNSFTATLDVNGGDVIDNNSVTLNYGEETTLTVPTRAHYDFTGWFVGDIALTDNNGKTFTNWEVPVPQIITAHWEPNYYSLEIQSNTDNAGTILGTGRYAYGSEVDVEATAHIGFKFIGWFLYLINI